jgi:hypothetical protein
MLESRRDSPQNTRVVFLDICNMSNISAICHSCKSLSAGDRTYILFALVKGKAPLLPLLRASRNARMMLGVQCSKSLYVETC